MTTRLHIAAVVVGVLASRGARADDTPSSFAPDATAPKTGGVLVEGLYGTDARGEVFGVRGVRVVATFPTHRATRFGLEAAFGDEERRIFDDTLRETRGTWTRLGGVLGWGAPWNDTVAGFLLGAGAQVATDRGREYGTLPSGAFSYATASRGNDTYDLARPRTITRWAVRPYVDWSLVLQIPIRRWSLRPTVGFTGMLLYDQDDGFTHLVFASAGLVWKAW